MRNPTLLRTANLGSYMFGIEIGRFAALNEFANKKLKLNLKCDNRKNHYLYIMANEKNPKESSNIFHSIMKASVSKPVVEKKEGESENIKPKSKSKK